MAIAGNLQDIDLFSLIQTLCQDGRDTRLTVRGEEERAELYLSGGNIVHATLGEWTGEEAVIRLLAWNEGTFTVERSVPAPTQTIFANVLGLLLEGIRKRDEEQAGSMAPVPKPGTSPATDLSENLTPFEARLWPLRDRLAGVLGELSLPGHGLEGILLVSSDGLTLGSEGISDPGRSARIGALAAGLLGMSQRCAFQLKHDMVRRIRISSGNGGVILVRVVPELFLVGILPDGDVDSSAIEEVVVRCARRLRAMAMDS